MLPLNYAETDLKNPKFPQPTPSSRLHSPWKYAVPLLYVLTGDMADCQTHKIFQQEELMITFERVPSPAHSLVPPLKFASYKSRTIYGDKPLEKFLFSLFS